MRSRIPEHVTHRLLIEKIYDAIDGIERLGRLNKLMAITGMIVAGLLALSCLLATLSVAGGHTHDAVTTPTHFQNHPHWKCKPLIKGDVYAPCFTPA